MSPRRRQRAITKNVISFFLRETISGAGAVREGEHQYLRAHSIRVVSTSLSFNKSWSVKQVLSAVTWRSNSVFASFYIKNISYIWDNCKSLGPFVAAGQVVDITDRGDHHR